jgi:uncharacterized damage-inducible protein DinB
LQQQRKRLCLVVIVHKQPTFVAYDTLMNHNILEVWLRGPIDGIPPHLQPVAHALLQAREEVESWMTDFPDDALWLQPASVASVGFHLQHLSGVLSRLFTYARGEVLSDKQLQALEGEGRPFEGCTVAVLLTRFREQVDACLKQLRQTDERTLLESRGVGRKQIPSTVLGLLVHAAEHTQRHAGQLHVTMRVVKDARASGRL